MWSRSGSIFLVTTVAVVCACPVRGEAATTTQPAAGLTTLRGHVSTSAGGLDIQRPDVGRVVVYLASDSRLDAAPAQGDGDAHVCVAQKNKAFVPNFVVVPRGTVVEFPNWDDFDHNVFSRSKAAPAFDLDRYPRGMSKSRRFDKLGVVQVFCNIHPQMRAVIYVTPNRYFARPDADGNFEIAGVPAGRYEVVAWNERCPEQRQAVEVRPDGPPAEVALTLSESRDRALNSSDARPRGSSYGGVERGLGIKRERLNLPVVTESHPAPPGSKP